MRIQSGLHAVELGHHLLVDRQTAGRVEDEHVDQVRRGVCKRAF